MAGKSKKQKKILDIGCGIGQNYDSLVKKGEYWGIDISSEFVKEAKKNCREGKFVVGDITKETSLPSSYFDEIYCFDILEHVRILRNALCEIKRTIKPKGKLIVEVPIFLSEKIFIALNPKYRKQTGHKRILREKDWIKRIEKLGFTLEGKSYKKSADILYLVL